MTPPDGPETEPGTPENESASPRNKPAEDVSAPDVAAETPVTPDDAHEAPVSETPAEEDASAPGDEASAPVWATTPAAEPPSNFGSSTLEADRPDAVAGAEPAEADDLDDEADDGVRSDEEVLAAGLEPEPGDTLVPTVMTILGLLVVAAAVLAAFLLPSSMTAPKHLPIGVVGAQNVQTQAKAALKQQYGESAFDITSYSTRQQLTRAIDHREVYGGIVVTPGETSMLIATAASLPAASRLATVANDIQLQFSNVKPYPSADESGERFTAAGLPLALIGLFPAIVLMLVHRRRSLAQFGTAIVASFALGIGAAAALTYWLHATVGANFWLVGIALSAGLLSTTLLLLGLNAVGGRIGAGIGVAALLLISLPLAGFSAGPEFIPQPWGAIGQFLPFGAAGTLLRNATFFDGLAVLTPLAVLGVWALIGLLMLGLSDGIPTTGADDPAEEPEPVKDPILSLP